jgi:hypothetical protein
MDWMGDWKFSLTHALSIVGFVVTIAIAYFGFRTFERWKREKIEEKRIDIAIEALALAYDTQEVFGAIRSAMSSGHEWADMPRRPGESDDAWEERGPFYAILKRVQSNHDCFEKLAKLRPRFMALFGSAAADNFKLVRESRAFVIVSAQNLCYRPLIGPDAQQQRTRMECDIWEGIAEAYIDDVPHVNRVDIRLQQFVTQIEQLCRPIIDRSYALNG